MNTQTLPGGPDAGQSDVIAQYVGREFTLTKGGRVGERAMGLSAGRHRFGLTLVLLGFENGKIRWVTPGMCQSVEPQIKWAAQHRSLWSAAHQALIAGGVDIISWLQAEQVKEAAYQRRLTEIKAEDARRETEKQEYMKKHSREAAVRRELRRLTGRN